jgi:phenylalanine-4-hydroxylase
MPQRALEKIPDHLAPYIVHQDPSLYTAIDHASWRFILKISQRFFSKHAHQKYRDGLLETGISTERIPLISEMDHCLQKFGWRAVAVSGFIPPAAFMEFQSLGVLPIACDMRKLEHLAYTPAPDIVHEAAGHAPIIADPEYSSYLRNYGEVSRKAIFSHHDLSVYQAIRTLSEVKEDPESSPEKIQAAQAALNAAIKAVDFDSEATLLARMNWWTVEYGLVGNLENPKIYGAGLLSSVGESYTCLGGQVKKLPLTVECVHTPYDITRPQPQLFVTPSFNHLSKVLNEFASTMAFKTGGVPALQKAFQAKSVTTTELESGVQIGGVLSEYIQDPLGMPAYLRFTGPTQLGFENVEIESQGAHYHQHGFGTPVGKIRRSHELRLPQELTERECASLSELEFESGIRVTGTITQQTRLKGRLLVLTWENCKVTMGPRVLFEPGWGRFDMACGTQVTSVFGGAPDRARYMLETQEFPQRMGFQKTNLTDDTLALNALYEEVRRLREGGNPKGAEAAALSKLQKIYSGLETSYPSDWLLRWELLELNHLWSLKAPWQKSVLSRLATIASQSPEKEQMIRRGMELFS